MRRVSNKSYKKDNNGNNSKQPDKYRLKKFTAWRNGKVHFTQTTLILRKSLIT